MERYLRENFDVRPNKSPDEARELCRVVTNRKRKFRSTAIPSKRFESHIQSEVKAAVEQVFKTYELTLGVTWVSCVYIRSLFSSILATMNQQLRSFEVITGDLETQVFTEVHTQNELTDDDFTSYIAISTPTTSEEDSLQSLGTTECSTNSTCKKPDRPCCKRRKTVNELDQFIPESSFPFNTSAQRSESESSGWGNSETASTNWVEQFGYMMYANQSDNPLLHQSRLETSDSGAPLLEGSAVVADVELMAIKVIYGNDIIRFDLPPSSSYADLMENILIRWGFLKDKAFVIKYLDDTSEPILLSADTDLQECMVRTKSKGINLIRMLIMEKDVKNRVALSWEAYFPTWIRFWF